jgi:hypothetical protein
MSTASPQTQPITEQTTSSFAGRGIVNVEIKTTFNFGGGLSLHTEYQLQVQCQDQQWIIYRRFKHFEKIHSHLVNLLSEAGAEARGLVFPEKSYYGSFLSTDKTTIDQRKTILQNFLNTVFKDNQFLEDEEIKGFLDVNGRGLSGIQKEFGGDKLLKETFCKVKVPRQYFGLIWSLCYVSLTKDGMLYVLSSMYDDSSNSLATWSLTAVGVQIIPKAKDNSIIISSTAHSKKLILSLPSALESAYWIRTLSDLATSTTLESIIPSKKDLVVPKHLSTGKRNSGMFNNNASPSSTSPNAAPVEHIYSKGTGNTEDELSAMYGI